MATYVVKARKTALKANFSASATQLTLNELLDSRGDPIVMASFGDWFALVVKQGSQVEIVKCDGLTQNGNGSATCNVATNGRNIDPVPPYEGSASGFPFLSGAEVIVTNDPLTMMYYLFNNENTWLQKQTFSVAPESAVNAVTANALIRKSQLDSAVLGVITSVSVVVQGIAGVTVADGDLIYFDTTADAWLKCDADTASTVNNVLLGIAQGSATIGNLIANGVMLRGTDDAQSGMSAGDIMYASNTAGDISNVAGTVPVAVGIASSATELYFEPRFNTGLSQNQVNALNGANNPSGSNVFVTMNDTSATPSANIIPKADANGTLNSFVTGLNTTVTAGETLAVGNPVAGYYYQSDGGVLLDAKTSTSSNSTSSLSTTITIAVQPNRTAVVIVPYATGSGFITSGVTFDGVAMTAVVNNVSLGSSRYVSAYRIVNPNTGASRTVTVTFTGTVSEAGLFIYSYYNTDTATPGTTYGATVGGAHSITPAVAGSRALSFFGWNSTVLSGNDLSNTEFQNPGGTAPQRTGDSGIIPNTLNFSSTASGSPLGGAYIVIKPFTALSFGSAKKTSASNTANAVELNLYNSFLGFVTAITGGGVLGTTTTVQHTGIVSGLSGLTPMSTYYLSDTVGVISTTAGTNSKKIGIALSATTLLLKNDN